MLLCCIEYITRRNRPYFSKPFWSSSWTFWLLLILIGQTSRDQEFWIEPIFHRKKMFCSGFAFIFVQNDIWLKYLVKVAELLRSWLPLSANLIAPPLLPFIFQISLGKILPLVPQNLTISQPSLNVQASMEMNHANDQELFAPVKILEYANFNYSLRKTD